MQKPTTISVLLVLASLRLVQAQNGNTLTGIWHNSDFGYQMTLMLNSDGSGEFDGESIRYALQGNRLTMLIGGESIIYTYSLTGTTLSLSGGDLDSPISFRQSGENGSSASRGNPTKLAQNQIDSPGSSNSGLQGIWSGNGETIEFRSNGQCLYRSNNFKYEATSDEITLIAMDGSVSFKYTIEGKQLTISGASGKAMYTKTEGAAGNLPTSSTKGVAMELVGRWCWINVTNTSSGGSSSSRCITLNADGTYVFESERTMSVNTDAFYGGSNSQGNDQGTWFVQGDRIHYNSQYSGQGSYRLEKLNHPKNVNDPMIVLDGEAYVTQTSRPPWR